MQPKLYVGRYLGHHARTGSIKTMTTDGVVKPAVLRRMNEESGCNRNGSRRRPQLIQRVIVITNFMRMLSGNVSVNVFKSDAVLRWAAIFRTPSSMFDKMLHMSKSQGSTMSRLRSHDFREAVSDLFVDCHHAFSGRVDHVPSPKPA